jgi:hypothetical protein
MLPILNPIPSDEFVTIEYEGPDTSSEKNLFRTPSVAAGADWITATLAYDLPSDEYMRRWDYYLQMVGYVRTTGHCVAIMGDNEERIWIFHGFQGQLPGLDPDKMEFRLDEDWIAQALQIGNWIPLVQF